jgi:hypothetical protein
MASSNIDQYIRPEFPVETASEGSFGSTWEYVGPTNDLRGNLPKIGQLWDDERPVTSYELVPSLDNSTHSRLTVSTVISINDAEGFNNELAPSKLQDVHYQLTYAANELPLFQHPDFLSGGGSDLYSNDEVFGSGASLVNAKPIAHIQQWESEPDQLTKFKRSYFKRDPSTGATTAPATVINGGAALEYIKLRELGFDSFTVFLPQWQKTSVYVGVRAPNTEEIGRYDEAPDAPPNALPKGYQWIKSADDAQRRGNQKLWDRTEVWSGFKKVYFDGFELNPAGNALP